MNIIDRIKPFVVQALKELYGQNPVNAGFKEQELTISATKPEFEGDYTLVLFSFVKQLKKSPEQLGNEIGEYLLKNNPDFFKAYNVIKGFLNLTIVESYWLDFLQTNFSEKEFGFKPSNG
ncbi:MAG: arginine--tRNA ligase, partial [Bacteroidota bacterium]